MTYNPKTKILESFGPLYNCTQLMSDEGRPLHLANFMDANGQNRNFFLSKRLLDIIQDANPRLQSGADLLALLHENGFHEVSTSTSLGLSRFFNPVIRVEAKGKWPDGQSDIMNEEAAKAQEAVKLMFEGNGQKDIKIKLFDCRTVDPGGKSPFQDVTRRRRSPI